MATYQKESHPPLFEDGSYHLGTASYFTLNNSKKTGRKGFKNKVGAMYSLNKANS